jgi:hypothetical protein
MGPFSPSAYMTVSLKASNPGAFLGSEAVPSLRAAGQLEQTPHNPIHTWVSSGNGFGIDARPDMGRTDTAALDPVFFTHHANVDRMWNKWLNQPGCRNHSSATFLNMRWTFFDGNRTAVSISTADVLNHEASLRYRYDLPVSANVSTPCATPTTILTIPLDSAPGTNFPSPRTFTAAPDPLTQFPILIGARPEFGAAVLLQIEGLDFTTNESVLVKIFWGKPDANAATPVSDPAFVGLISNLPTGGARGTAT